MKENNEAESDVSNWDHVRTFLATRTVGCDKFMAKAKDSFLVPPGAADIPNFRVGWRSATNKTGSPVRSC